MKKSLTINAIRNGKKVSKSLGYINSDAANSIVGGFGGTGKQEGRILFDYNSATGEGNTYTECDTSDVLPFYSKRLSSSFISRLYKYL